MRAPARGGIHVPYGSLKTRDIIKKDIAFHKKEVFNEKLAPQDRRPFEQAEEAFEQEALEFDKGPNVTGVYSYLDELRYG